MRRARWLVDWSQSKERPALYHCISRVVDRRRVLGDDEKEMFRSLMRRYERFTGCRVISYCLMDDHFHLLIEVPNPPPNGISNSELLDRLAAIYSEDHLANISAELNEVQSRVVAGDAGAQEFLDEIHARYTPRMHSLSQFMKALLQRYTQWHNHKHGRRGTLWEDRFKSVIVEAGLAARTLSIYIDLNPIRAGIEKRPETYRWSSYGEAIGDQNSSGDHARAGLVRAWGAHLQAGPKSLGWKDSISKFYRKAVNTAIHRVLAKGATKTGPFRSISSKRQATTAELKALDSVLPFGAMLQHRIRYFTDGAVIGSKAFVNQAFRAAKERFGPKRKSGARRLRGAAAPAAEMLWSLRDLRT